MITPEKNDVDISKLFNWGKKLNLVDSKDNVILSVWVRLIGDAEINRARTAAIRKSTELRDKLKDKESDEHVAYIAEKGDLDRQGLENILLLFRSKDFYELASKSITIKFPREPRSDASLEDQEKYQKEVDAYPAKLQEAIKEEIDKLVDREKEHAEKLSDKELYDLYVKYQIQDLCEKEMYRNFRELCVFYGTYSDAEYKNKLFNSFSDFKNLPPEIKTQLEDGYFSLDLTMDELKK